MKHLKPTPLSPPLSGGRLEVSHSGGGLEVSPDKGRFRGVRKAFSLANTTARIYTSNIYYTEADHENGKDISERPEPGSQASQRVPF
jgi:hypothetical protein